ncbi:LAGLIDADG DNA endonuclease family protein [Paraliobacillus sp. PM-2]|uniref:hypothetical protein n=1 Tax=Paraliobacillus sp. PM-2 TaxID=1462524 RepID=UPI00061CAD1C|nr:hypothetical protein [Paraliobacillus sp. PM-2]CQR46403.1 LAGLIDADG DNA endonuclease family protein [Paraliobacillus sp. PM-2]
MNNEYLLNQFPPDFHAKMIGKLLGDGTITKQFGRKARFQFSHTAKDKDWTFYCYQQIVSFFSLSKPIYRKTIDQRLEAGYSESYMVQSHTSPIIDTLEELWYEHRKKVLPLDYISKYFNAVSLAWWYQDDGSLKQENNFPRKIILSTECFTKKERQFLQMLLLEKFNLLFKQDKQNRMILYDASSIFYFLSLIEQYIQPSMTRKIIQNRTFQLKSTSSKRSTIYLPNEIIITSPTKEINCILTNLEIIWRLFRCELFYEQIYKSNKSYIHSDIVKTPYQIVIQKKQLYLLHLLKVNTGLTFSQLTSLCFKLFNESENKK